MSYAETRPLTTQEVNILNENIQTVVNQETQKTIDNPPIGNIVGFFSNIISGPLLWKSISDPTPTPLSYDSSLYPNGV
jgi:hypothetical protein